MHSAAHSRAVSADIARHVQASGGEAGMAAQASWEGGRCLAGLAFLPPACWEPLLRALAQPLLAVCHSKASSSSGGPQLSPSTIAAAAGALASGGQAGKQGQAWDHLRGHVAASAGPVGLLLAAAH